MVDGDAMGTLEQRYYIQEALRNAIASNSLQLVYQPIFDTHSRRIVGAEALSRLPDKAFGTISPADFIPIAEESGLIVELTDLVIKRVCAFWRTIGDQNGALERISVNLSVVNILQPLVEHRLWRLIVAENIDPVKFDFELTESMLIESYDTVERAISSLNRNGISFSLDDYGKGYSNMETLLKLPFKTVKLDKSIIGYCETHHEFLKSIVQMLHKIDKVVVAEGVETARQFQVMRDLGVDRMQGYFLARPMQEQAFLGLIRSA